MQKGDLIKAGDRTRGRKERPQPRRRTTFPALIFIFRWRFENHHLPAPGSPFPGAGVCVPTPPLFPLAAFHFVDQFNFFSLGITRIPEPADKDFFFLFLKQDGGEAVRWEEVEDIPPVRKSCPATSQFGARWERGLRTGPRTVLWWCGGERVTGLSQVRPPR